MGPYRIESAAEELGSYRLCELDGSSLKGSISGRRLKKFFDRGPLVEDVAEDMDLVPGGVQEDGVEDILELVDDDLPAGSDAMLPGAHVPQGFVLVPAPAFDMDGITFYPPGE